MNSGTEAEGMNGESRLPVAPFMMEHRLMERMMDVMGPKTKLAEESGVPDIRFIDAAVDFIPTYTDRLHHGKEESILFRALAAKPLSDEHRQMMDELVAEHVLSRQTTDRLVEAKLRYVEGDRGAVTDIIDCLFTLAELYPRHMEKEDRLFFGPVMRYFTHEEQVRMLAEEGEFDRRFVHVSYGSMVDEWAKDVERSESIPI